MAPREYRRTPLPEPARDPVGWIALNTMALIFSPFVGFAIHGRVAEPGLRIGLVVALLPLAGLAAAWARRWRAWQQLPPQIVDEWTTGKVVPPEGAPRVKPPARFADHEHWIEFQAGGFCLSRSCVLSVRGLPDALAELWVADQLGHLFVPWREVTEWSVHTDSDGPDYCVVHQRAGGQIRVRRFAPAAADECDVLDAVRSVGGVPVRLCCDVSAHS